MSADRRQLELELTAQPSGVVSFWFTDVEGSTGLWASHPDEMRIALEIHDQILTDVAESHDGYVFSTAGDSFAVAFAHPEQALNAAISAQQQLTSTSWPSGASVHVRMGLHAGAAIERNGDYFGPEVNRAARVMSLAAGGQILISDAIRALGHVDSLALGRHRLRGFEETEDLHQVIAPELPDRFPPLPGAEDTPTNLRERDRSFVGREAELAQVAALIRRHRLVTIVGPGGIGKTSAAQQVASATMTDYAGGVWYLGLASLRRPDQVLDALAGVIDARQVGGQSMLDAVVMALGHGPSLLVLDNCEHLVDVVADLTQSLIDRLPGLRVLATSRRPIRVSGEQLVTLSPLDVSTNESPAVRLFLDRASEVLPDYHPDAESLHDIVVLCRQLDGLPLAIELAAARTRTMNPAELAERLHGRISALRSDRRDTDPRQRTVEATVDWSYQLLSEPARRLLQRLSVFVGGFDLLAVESVCSDEGLDEFDVDEALDEIIDHSLALTTVDGSTRRFHLLEPIREFAAIRLDDKHSFESAHTGYYADLAWRGYLGLWSADEGQWIRTFDLDFDNCRAAHGRALHRNDVDAAVRIGLALILAGEVALQRPDGATVLEATLELAGISDHELYPLALIQAGLAQTRRQNLARADELCEAAVTEADERTVGEVRALNGVRFALIADSRRLTENAAAARRENAAANARPEHATWLTALDVASRFYPYGEVNADWLEEFEPIHPSSYTTAVTVTMYGSMLGRLGRVDECLGVFREAVRQALEVGNKATAASTFLTEVTWALRLRPEEVTLKSLQQWAPTWRKANDHNRMQWLLAVAAYRLALDGCHEEAATLIGGVSGTSERVRAPLEEGSRLAREAMGDEAFDERSADGGSMTLVELYDLLMGASPCA